MFSGTPASITQRIPPATWFRLRHGAEHSGAALVVTGEQVQAGSCAKLQLAVRRKEVLWSAKTAARHSKHRRIYQSAGGDKQMFASIYAPGNLPILLDCARGGFSPLVEITSDDMVTFDVRGLGRVYGAPGKIAREIDRVIGMPANVAIAANPDTAVAGGARGVAGISVIFSRRRRAGAGPALFAASVGLSARDGRTLRAFGEYETFWASFARAAGDGRSGTAGRGRACIGRRVAARGGPGRQLRLVDEKNRLLARARA